MRYDISLRCRAAVGASCSLRSSLTFTYCIETAIKFANHFTQHSFFGVDEVLENISEILSSVMSACLNDTLLSAATPSFATHLICQSAEMMNGGNGLANYCLARQARAHRIYFVFVSRARGNKRALVCRSGGLARLSVGLQLSVI